MHQTFYIDIDEEITSIVDRLRKSKADEVIIVVPKRALLIQSVVNLKLLKKESDSLKKQIMIVTQDKLGKLLIEKTGILVQQKLDDIEGEELESAPSQNEPAIAVNPAAKSYNSEVLDLKKRLENIGSEEYFENPEEKNKEYSLPKEEPKIIHTKEVRTPEEKIINKELVIEAGIDMRKAKVLPLQDIDGASSMVKNLSIREPQNAYYDTNVKSVVAAPMIKTAVRRKSFTKETLPAMPRLPEDTASLRAGKAEQVGLPVRNPALQDSVVGGPESLAHGVGSDFFEGAKIENFFQHKSTDSRRREERKSEYKNVSISGKIWKMFLIFGFIALLIMCLALAYLFVPRAEVMIYAKSKTKSVDTEVQASTEVKEIDTEKQRIPSTLIILEEEISRSYSSTGTKPASNQRAKGIITIYNEYSTASQPLVATTRFLSEDRKLFRLVKSVTIPGMSKLGEEMKPGAIEAEVMANEAGESFNIGPAKFTIPGFENSGADKYQKFYARSSKSMSGGGSGNGTVKVVSSGDINTAKSKLIAELNEMIKKKLKDSTGGGQMVLDEAIDTSESTYTLSSLEGEAADSFTISVKTKAKALLFKEGDLKEVLNSLIIKAGDGRAEANKLSLTMEFGKADADFSKESLMVRLRAKGKLIPNVDKDNLRKGVLGKNEEDLKSYLSTYPDINKVEVNYWPSFISGKIPAYENRVKVEILESEGNS